MAISTITIEHNWSAKDGNEAYASQLAVTPLELQTLSDILILSREKKTSWI
jgi:hypothetical protein